MTYDCSLKTAPTVNRRFASLRYLFKTTRQRDILLVSVFLFFGSNAASLSQERLVEPITPVPQHTNLEQPKVELGKRLFYDSRLSGTNGVSCASCHLSQFAFTDGQPISRGLPGAPGITNTPTIFNVGLNSLLNWSGQIKTLEEQADRVIERKNTMGGHWPDVVANLKNDREITEAFDAVFPDGVKRENIVNALAEYERSLNTPNAPFDRYLRGDDNAISVEAKAGYDLFKDYGCISCHQGVNVGGNMLQVFGIFGTPEAADNGVSTQGAAQGTGISDKEPVFRVPSLRNVANTAPYFHNGSAATLDKAINVMALNQLGRDLSEKDVDRLKAFLQSLTGEFQGTPIGKLEQ